jgi:hypothetical protein
LSGLTGRHSVPGVAQMGGGIRPISSEGTPFLATMILGPNLLTAAIAAGMGSNASYKWAAPTLILCGPLLVAAFPQRFNRQVLARITLAAAGLTCVLPSGAALHTLVKPCLSGKPIRESWPQAEMSERFQRIWQEQVSRPMGIVAGSYWVAGLVALKPRAMPSILTDGDMRLSPWITPERLRREGALAVWEMSGPAAQPPDNLRWLLGTKTTGMEQFAFPLCPGGKPLLIGYAIVPPE